MYYNLKENRFVKNLPNVNQTDFLRITTCDKSEQVITLIAFGEDPLCLHNEDEETN